MRNGSETTLRGWFTAQKRAEWLGLALAAVAFAAGYAANYQTRAAVIRQTTVRHVERSWGKPDQTLPAAQVNPQLPSLGVNRCDMYGSRKTVVCHP